MFNKLPIIEYRLHTILSTTNCSLTVRRCYPLMPSQFVYDPTHYKNNLLKIYNLGVKMKPARQLAMYYEDFDKEGIRHDYVSDSSAEEDERRVEVKDEAIAKQGANNNRRTPGGTLITPKSLVRDATVTKVIYIIFGC